MPEPPAANPFVRYVLENPYPLAIALLAVGLGLGWLALREGRLGTARGRVAIGLVIAGAAVLAAGMLIVTPGERARAVTRDLVDRATGGDVTGAVALLSDDLTLALGSPQNPGVPMDRAAITERLDRLHAGNRIESNLIRMLEARTVDSGEVDVYLGCLTETEYGFTPSRWVLRLRRDEDGAWVVVRITCVEINNQAPPSNRLW